MTGREDKKENDLFYTCSLIDYIARKTKNRRAAIVNALGKDRLTKIYDLADIYHSDNIDRVSDDFIEAACILPGKFDNVADNLRALILGMYPKASIASWILSFVSSFILSYRLFK